MSKKIIVVLLCFVALNVSARQVITGTLTDKETTAPIDGASVELLQLPDSSIVENTNSNSDGLFMFYKADTVKSYCVRVKHVVYKTMSVVVTPKKGSMINNLGIISLESTAFNLKEIVVNGTKVSVTEMADRTVYRIPDAIQKTSSDGLDVLRKIPAVQVDYLNEDITVNGKSNIVIEVDGITRNKAYLKRLHPSQISKMEIITSPSGKYDADVDAVINIVTNPAMRYGLKGMAYLGAFPISSDSYLGMSNASLDYGLEKVSYYVAGNYIPQHFGVVSDMTRIAGAGSVQQNSSTTLKGGFGGVNAGLIWDPDELNDINLNFAYNNNSYNSVNDVLNEVSSDNEISSVYRTISKSENNSEGLTSSLFYKHKFDKKTQHGLEAELNYYTDLKNNSTTKFQNTYYDPENVNKEILIGDWQNENVKTNVQTIWGQSNYTLPFDSVYTFNAGISGNYNDYSTDNTSTLPNVSNMVYSDLRIGAFAELARNFKNGSVRLGSRFETSHVIINSSTPHNYSSPLPYMNASYKFNDANSIKLSYSRRVVRPSASQLNPFVSVVDSQTISHGNLDLKPAYRDNIQLTYNTRINVKKLTFNVSPQLFYEYKTGLIQTILSQNSITKVFESVPTNISNGYETGGIMSLNSQIGKVMFNSNFRYSFYHVDEYLDQIVAMNRHGWNWNSFLMCPLPLDLQFMAMLNMTGPVLDGQTETKTSGMYFMGLGKQFKSHTVRLMAFNPFSSNFFTNKTTITGSSFSQVSNSYMHKSYGFLLMYAYSFKLGKSIDKQKHNSDDQMQNNILKLPISF
jgi:hypothetical protein